MAHIHEKIDFTVEVFVVYKNKVLLRKHDKYKIWLSVGGHIELNEDPVQAAHREVEEEVGLKIELWDPRTENGSDDYFEEMIPPIIMGRHGSIHPTNHDHIHITMIYFARAVNDNVTVRYEGDRSDEWKWFTKEEIERMDLRSNVRTYALRALKELAS
jgi:8-oxo-dGTP pyrophosphatase MutT (NUDIX family)